MEEALESFLDSGWITEVIGVVKSGKEATVYCCRGGEKARAELVAAKVYRSREHRNFKNDTRYWDGYVILGSRYRRAFEKKTAFGKIVQAGLWQMREYEMMSALHEAGADIPRPIAGGESAMLMEYMGTADAAASKLQECRPSRDIARAMYERLMWNIELFLSKNCIHGDLSPYNILVQDDRATIIDFPQAVDPRMNRQSSELLQRDIRNVAAYFEKYGVRDDYYRRGAELWSRFVNGQM
ncbi:MAG TPA: RIO1 family regulatory kinase/ATPase [Planctomycetota bacterium]|nr:RIO1 family regulatory kinase/ATPase [Planctomycetota bacterium]